MTWTRVRAVLLILHLLAQLLWWDLLFKIQLVANYRAARRRLDRTASWCALRLFAIARYFTAIRIQTELDHVTLPSQFLVLANHQSLLDIVAIMAAFRNHSVRFVAKAELTFGFPAVSHILRVQRHALIHRKGHFNVTMRRIERLARSAVGNICPVIFPEGTRSRDGRLREFHSGAVRRILDINPLPVVTVAIEGGWRFSTLARLAELPIGMTYRLRVVRCDAAPHGKQEILSILDKASAAIDAQLLDWRKEGNLEC